MRSVTHLRSLQALDLALRAGSLKAVARELGVTPAAVGQRSGYARWKTILAPTFCCADGPA